MKSLLLLFIAGWSFITHAKMNESELISVPPITPVSYDKKNSVPFADTLSKALAMAGDQMSFNVEQEVLKNIKPYREELTKKYFTEKELDSFLKKVINEGIEKHLTRTVHANGKDQNVQRLTDAKLIKFYDHLGLNLIGGIADKILEKEGITDPDRRDLWVAHLTRPFSECMAKADNYKFDANNCMDALSKSLVPNTVMGIVYELSRTNLNGSLDNQKEKEAFNVSQTQEYTSCITGKKNPDATMAKDCALSAMKKGVGVIAKKSLLKTLSEKASSKQAAEKIRVAVLPALDSCLHKIGGGKGDKEPDYTSQFTHCTDSLVRDAGTLIVADAIGNNSSLKKLFSEDITKSLAAKMSGQFKTCADQQIKANIKKNGVVDISPCESQATNTVTYKAVVESFKKAAKEYLTPSTVQLKRIGLDAANSLHYQAKIVGDEGARFLDECWSDKQNKEERESCLRKAILKFSGRIATIKLDEAIPSDLKNRQQLQATYLSQLNACIDSKLPKNISESENPTQGLSVCTDDLTLRASKEVTGIAFGQSLYENLEKMGDLPSLGLDSRKVESFLKDLNDANVKCIDKKSNEVMREKIDACIKASIRKIALFVGEIKFKKSVGAMYEDRPKEGEKFGAELEKNLGKCLDKSSDKKFSIDEYKQNITFCADQVNASTTLAVGKDQVNFSIDQYLKDRPKQNLGKLRNELKTKLLGDFTACMSNPKRVLFCADELKRDSTQKIVLNYLKVETKTQLNTDTTPPELKSVESDFRMCTIADLEGDKLSNHLDQCTKDLAISFARELGNLKMHYLMKTTLGSETYDDQKAVIDASLLKYNACLGSLKDYPMKKVSSLISNCTNGLTAEGLKLVRRNLRELMPESDDPTIASVQDFYSAIIPCLSNILPSSPYTPALAENITSPLKIVAFQLGNYIEYDPDNAKHTLEEIIRKFQVDLNDVAATEQAKRSLIKFLQETNSLDQFIKSIVRGTVVEAMKGIAEEDFPKKYRDILVDKQNFEKMFNTPEGKDIKNFVIEKLLNPVLLGNEDPKSKVVKSNIEDLKNNVIKILVEAPSFGQTIVSKGIQVQINHMRGITKFFAKIAYGKNSLDWEKIRLTNAGKKAEDYIKENVLYPKFKGEVRSKDEEKKIVEEAKELVTKAVKNSSEDMAGTPL